MRFGSLTAAARRMFPASRRAVVLCSAILCAEASLGAAQGCELSRDYFDKRPLGTYCSQQSVPVRSAREPAVSPIMGYSPDSAALRAYAPDPYYVPAGYPTPGVRRTDTGWYDVFRRPFPDWRLQPRTAPHPYSFGEFADHVSALRTELIVLAAGLSLYGLKSWGWGSSGFHFQNEGFFGRDTAYGGMDKLGHAFSTMVLADFLNARLSYQFGAVNENYAMTASILSFGTMFFVEVFDGLAKDHGFSREDLVIDAAGALFSYFRNTIPGMREKIDYRVQYWPSGAKGDPAGDYNGQKYILALKLAGFETFHDNPLRFLEVHAGYYARSTPRGDNERHLYAGLGLNLNEIFFSDPASRQTWVGSIVSPAFEYVQVPYTALNSDLSR